MSTPQLEISVKPISTGQVRRFTLNQRDILVGTLLSNDIVLHGKLVEAEHCRLEIQDQPNNIVYHRKNGPIKGTHGAIIPDKEAIAFNTEIFIGDNSITIKRLDVPPLPIEDPTSQEEEDKDPSKDKDNTYHLIDNDNNTVEQSEDVIDNDEDTSFSADGEVDSSTSKKSIQSNVRLPFGENTRLGSSYRLQLLFIGIFVCSLLIGGGSFYYISTKDNNVQHASTKNNPIPLNASSATSNKEQPAEITATKAIENILDKNNIEIEEIIPFQNRFTVVGYARTNADIRRLRENIQEAGIRNTTLKIYSDEQILTSVDVILSTKKENIFVDSLSFGRLRLKGDVNKKSTVDSMKKLLQEDIPFLKSVNMANVRIVDDPEKTKNELFEDTIVGVWMGENPFLQMANGRRYSEGDVLNDGRLILDISQDEVVLMFNSELDIVSIRDLE